MCNRLRKLRCFKCHEEGHIARCCRSIRVKCSDSESSKSDETKCSNSQRMNERKLKCFNCQNYGHIARYCKKPKHPYTVSENQRDVKFRENFREIG
ncbi:hypothetical protein B4U80_15008 [Leptotrombidium deliense]|uniref:CCHC-type domain-containing protein n=1 Tax=Leptotrombidium deliense TaxID=299467 RepID=A0A443RTX3_9ACAR|nr:hypothetical protein B4U80_15008 [Leptotrombidium deliense]